DGLPLAETALPTASLLAEILGADVELLRVVPADPPPSLESDASEYLRKVASSMGEQGFEVHARVLRGNPAECILVEARAEHIAMVIMPTHARSGLRRAVLGSVATAV